MGGWSRGEAYSAKISRPAKPSGRAGATQARLSATVRGVELLDTG